LFPINNAIYDDAIEIAFQKCAKLGGIGMVKSGVPGENGRPVASA